MANVEQDLSKNCGRKWRPSISKKDNLSILDLSSFGFVEDLQGTTSLLS